MPRTLVVVLFENKLWWYLQTHSELGRTVCWDMGSFSASLHLWFCSIALGWPEEMYKYGNCFRNLKLLTTDPLKPQITSRSLQSQKERHKKTKVASVPTRQKSAKAQQKKGDLKCIHHRRKERPGSPENYFVAPCAAFSTTAKESLWVKLGANLPLSKQETNHELNTLNLQQ